MAQGWPRLHRALRRDLASGVDRALSDCLPEIGEWSDTFAFDMGLYSGAAAESVSAFDFFRTDDGSNRFPAAGYGALIARLAEPIAVRLNCAVARLRIETDRVVAETSTGDEIARHVIVTAPVELLRRGAIAFDPPLPPDVASAFSALMPAAYEHAILRWPDSPLHRNGADQLTFFKSDRRDGATMLACINGGDLHYVELGGPQRAVWNEGESDWKRAYVAQFLKRQFGPESERAEIVHVTDWWNDPWSRGSWSVAPPGGAEARDVLRRHGGDSRLRFASEATSLTQWGTAGGAWREGARAAREIIAQVERKSR